MQEFIIRNSCCLFWWRWDWTKFRIAIEAILKKQDYHNLQNLNLVLSFNNLLVHGDWFFNLLKKNKDVLKYQFKQLNIGLLNDIYDVHQVIEWNDSIDDKYLDNICHECQTEYTLREYEKQKQNLNIRKLKYQALLNQWL